MYKFIYLKYRAFAYLAHFVKFNVVQWTFRAALNNLHGISLNKCKQFSFTESKPNFVRKLWFRNSPEFIWFCLQQYCFFEMVCPVYTVPKQHFNFGSVRGNLHTKKLIQQSKCLRGSLQTILEMAIMFREKARFKCVTFHIRFCPGNIFNVLVKYFQE